MLAAAKAPHAPRLHVSVNVLGARNNLPCVDSLRMQTDMHMDRREHQRRCCWQPIPLPDAPLQAAAHKGPGPYLLATTYVALYRHSSIGSRTSRQKAQPILAHKRLRVLCRRSNNLFPPALVSLIARNSHRGHNGYHQQCTTQHNTVGTAADDLRCTPPLKGRANHLASKNSRAWHPQQPTLALVLTNQSARGLPHDPYAKAAQAWHYIDTAAYDPSHRGKKHNPCSHASSRATGVRRSAQQHKGRSLRDGTHI